MIDETEDEENPNRRGAYQPKPLPPNDGTAWMKQGSCAGRAYSHPEQADLWFSDPGTYEDRDATAVCFGCPVRKDCLKWACDVEEPGTWGGLNGRIRRHHKHNYPVLVELSNPYETPKHVTSVYHPRNLKPHTERED